jgi:hypothetical protein
MKKTTFILLLTIGLFSLLFYSCKKNDTNTTDYFPNTTGCFLNASTERKIIDKPATVIEQGVGVFYIVEQGTIDTRLNPCNLPDACRVNNLQVTISGDVKTTVQGAPAPCCTDDFVITKITR